MHVKKGDTVVVINGEDKNKKGKILKVYPDNMTVLVEGVNRRTKHKKPRGQYQQGGIIHQESPINSSKVMVFCSECNRGVRIKKEFLDNGNKVRACIKCGAEISTIEKNK
jgi:large subunit ribosomal protein L24